ncbi:Transposase DDE domain-containing protein [Methylomagnum ishizawai]|uniref:Transposase DDE domain-containing protein n=1 Tax=Methylomagnum ishizawai TaxID=1760988 RepID=A0A1Y6DA20_9GAMM|nr:IS4 family transposase [Methylomagnum ishizawai]SMF95105.1 Transposase DDE domain-containing protein [Methylomagnum ishizawai]SMF96555.1 Transposase DDE domain-containing protein [Methylomagnum ishizawai]SMF97835.1 Transposase DDE domain-containing protein [Methylomagnum ishizawai]
MADPHQDLKAVLSEHLPWHGARIGFLAHFLLALLKVRSVNLAELATGFGGPAKVESHYKRLQRFFRAFELDQDVLARLLVRLVPVGDGPWRLTLDRTNWKFGLAEINFLVLGIAHRGMAVPVFWSVLGKAGNSDTAERIALMERFLKVFGTARIAALLADREFIGEDWFRWLQQKGIPFHQRLKRDTRVPNSWNRMMRLDQLFGSLRPGETHRLVGRRPVWGCFVHLSALRLDDGGFLFIASSGTPQAGAIDAYADRWQVETLFGALKSRGFNLEDTHLTDPKRLAKLMGLLALAFAWPYRTGELLHDGPSPVRQKKRCRAPSSPSSATDSTSFATPS